MSPEGIGTLFGWALLATIAACGTPAQAATLTFTMDGCTGFALSTHGELTCVTTGPPAPPPPPSPPPPPPPTCAGARVLDLDWNNPTVTAKTGALGQSDVVVVRITTGLAGGYGKISGAEYGGSSAGRMAILSATPCDFSWPPPLGWGATSVGNTVEILFSNGPNPYGYPALAPNATAYFNLKTTGNCGTNCSMLFQLNKY